MGKRISVLSTRGNVTVPENIRKRQNWKPGQKFSLIPNGRGVLIVPVPSTDESVDDADGTVTPGDGDGPNRAA